MKHQCLIVFGISLLLMGCDKTDNLYIRNAYNSSNFEENYYTDYDGLDIVNFEKKTDISADFKKIEANEIKENMSKRNPEYKKGILSKLYDGRLECGGYFQLSRVQLKNEGFGTRLPETLNINSMQFSMRGGSTCEAPLRRYMDFDYYLTIYTNTGYYEFVFDGNLTPVDKNSETRKFEASFANTISGVIGYSLKWECSEFYSTEGVTPDKELALMLYEVVLD